MVSPRRVAQLGVGAATLVLICSMALLASGGAEAIRLPKNGPFTVAPDFTLSDSHGRPASLSRYRGRVVVLCFTSDHCPVAQEYDQRLSDFARHWADDSRVRVLAVNTDGSADRRSATPARRLAPLVRSSTTTLLDSKGEVARRYGVERTPTFFVVDGDGVIRYRGAFDDSRAVAQVKSHYCQIAVESLLRNEPVEHPWTDVTGCVTR